MRRWISAALLMMAITAPLRADHSADLEPRRKAAHELLTEASRLTRDKKIRGSITQALKELDALRYKAASAGVTAILQRRKFHGKHSAFLTKLEGAEAHLHYLETYKPMKS